MTQLKGKSPCCIISHGKGNRNSELLIALPGALLTECRQVSSSTAISSSHTFPGTHHFLAFLSATQCAQVSIIFIPTEGMLRAAAQLKTYWHICRWTTLQREKGSHLVRGSAHCYSTPSSMYVMQIMQNFPTLNAYLNKQCILQSTVYNIQKFCMSGIKQNTATLLCTETARMHAQTNILNLYLLQRATWRSRIRFWSLWLHGLQP